MRSVLTIVLGLFGLTGCATYPYAHEPYRVVDRAHSGGNALAIDRDSKLGASGGWSGKVRLWRLQDGTPLGGWRTGHGDLYGLLFLGTNQLLTAGYDGYVRIWHLDGTLERSFQAGAAITSFRATETGSHIMLGHNDGMTSLWQVNGSKVGAWPLSSRRIAAVAVEDGLGLLAAADKAGNVWRWELGESPSKLESPPTFPRSLIFHRNTKNLLGSGWFNLFVWSNAGNDVSVMSTDHRGIINHLELGPNGAYLASISRQTDSSILLLNPVNGETLSAFSKHDLCGQRIALSPDGRIMMSTSDDATVRFYRLPAVGKAGSFIAVETP